MDTNHFQRMKHYIQHTLESPLSQERNILLVGASPDLKEIPQNALLKHRNIMFLDNDQIILNQISEEISVRRKDIQFCNSDITNSLKRIKSEIINLYLKGNSPTDTIIQLSDYFYEFSCSEVYTPYNTVQLSLNVVSELQPPIRLFQDQIHKFFFGGITENTIPQKEMVDFLHANDVLYNRFVSSHIARARNIAYSDYYVSAYESAQSYLDAFCVNPSDKSTEMYIRKLLPSSSGFRFWNWHIDKTRVIRMCRFIMDNGYEKNA